MWLHALDDAPATEPAPPPVPTEASLGWAPWALLGVAVVIGYALGRRRGPWTLGPLTRELVSAATTIALRAALRRAAP